MEQLTGIARFTFKPGRVEEFKELSARCMEIVRDLDRGTLSYDIFLTPDETEAVVVERYRDSAALVEHLAHIGDELMGAIMDTTASVDGWTLGTPSDELRSGLEGGPVRLLAPFLSMSSTDDPPS